MTIHLKYHEAMIKTAHIWSQLSSCNRLKVGAVLAKNNRIIGVGYNGTISGMSNDCEDEQGKTRDNVIHAEKNVLLFCAKEGISVDGASLYVTHSPCLNCSSSIAQSGIKNVFYMIDYKCDRGIKQLVKFGVDVFQIPTTIIGDISK